MQNYRTDPPLAETLARLAELWPVGARVQHQDPAHGRWTGRIVPDGSGDHPGRTVGTAPAHTTLGVSRAVHVEPDRADLPPMWITVGWLRRVDTAPAGRPGERARTRSGRAPRARAGANS